MYLASNPVVDISGTHNVDAYNLFLQARSIFLRAHDKSGFATVEAYLRQSIAADPQFAKAWALLEYSAAI
jgi:hypothetical protein